MALASQKLQHKICKTCGQLYSNFRTSKNGNQYWVPWVVWEQSKFCKSSCISHKEILFKNCKACGKMYSNARKYSDRPGNGTVSDEKWFKAQWCSKECRWATQAAIREEKPCLQCGKMFSNELQGKSYKAGQVCNSARFITRRFCGNKCSLSYRQHRSSLQAYRDNVGAPEKNGCILWKGHRTKSGHGRIELKDIGGKGILAHRLAYALFKGPVPGNRMVCHDCHNAPCVNPGHLYLGDDGTNQADRYRRPRPEVIGVKHPYPDVYVDESGKLIVASTDA